MTAVQGQGAHLSWEEDGQQGFRPTPPKPLTGQLSTIQGKPHPEDEEIEARGREEAPQGHEGTQEMLGTAPPITPVEVVS